LGERLSGRQKARSSILLKSIDVEAGEYLHGVGEKREGLDINRFLVGGYSSMGEHWLRKSEMAVQLCLTPFEKE
jgi:hypothetical protein